MHAMAQPQCRSLCKRAQEKETRGNPYALPARHGRNEDPYACAWWRYRRLLPTGLSVTACSAED